MEDDAKTDVMDVKRGARLCVSFYEMFAASALAVSFACGLIMFIYRMKSSAVVAEHCGYLWVQGSHDGIHPVYYKTEIRTFFLLLQERGDVDPVALGYGFGV